MTVLRTLILSMLLCAGGSALAIDVCRTFNFSGFERQMRAAEAVLGKAATSNRDQMKVFITVVEGQLYVHSNYIIPGTEAPTKLAIDTKTSLGALVWNLITDDPAQVPREEAEVAIRNQITFYVDRFRLAQSQFADLDFSAAKSIVDINESIMQTREPSATSTPASSPDLATQSQTKSDTITTPPSAAASSSAVPKTVSEAAIQVLWTSTAGRWLLVVAAALAAAFGLLVALPEGIRQTLLRRIGLASPAAKAAPKAPRTRARR